MNQAKSRSRDDGVATKHIERVRMSKLWRSFILGLFLALGLGAAFAQTVVREGLTDKGWSGLRYWVDVNADGRDDFCELTGGSQQYLDCYMSDGTSFQPMTRFTNVGTSSVIGHANWADVNGDGFPDFCRATGRPGDNMRYVYSTVTCYLGPTFTSTRVAQMPLHGVDGTGVSGGLTDFSYWFMVDVNNDGRADLCYVFSDPTGSRMKCMLATDSGFSAESAAWTGPLFDAGLKDWPHAFSDFNGDGTPDYCSVSSGGVIQCMLFKPTGISAATVVRSSSMTMSSQYGAQFVDINGDGNVDYCRQVNSAIKCRISTGVAWDTVDWSSGDMDLGDSGSRFWVDANGDGVPDFCRLVQTTTMSCRLGRGGVSYDTGSNPFVLSDVTVGIASAEETGLSDGGRAFCDPTGAGISTFCRLVQRSTVTGQECRTGQNGDICNDIILNTWAVFAGLTDATLQGRSPLLTSFRDGLGSETRITYLPMSSTDVYTHSAPVAGNGYPHALLATGGRAPLVYESRVWTAGTSPTALSGTARYFYKDSRSDVSSGALGFRDRWMFTESSNSLDHVVYFQGLGPTVDATSILGDWREIGQIKYKERFAVANALVPTPQNVGLLSDRQARLNAIGAAARAQATIQPVAPSSASPFILLSTATNTLSDTTPANAGYRFIGDSVARSWDWTGSSLVELPRNETTTVTDNYGNVSSIVQTTSLADGTVWKRITTNNRYDADNPATWLLGRLTKSSVKTEAASASDQLGLYARSAGRSPDAATTSSPLPPAPSTMPGSLLMPIITLLLSD